MNGIINVNKPKGITSFDVVREIKKIAGTKKVGHTGTLDPLATGVLPVCIGKATKLVDFIMDNYKVYKATMKLGIVTDTLDTEGKELARFDVNVNDDEIKNAIMSFVGEIYQIPPMYSALKVNGKKLYELARQGIEIEREKRKINIYHINIINIEVPYVTFEVKCSKGTYIRSLCHDIGEKLGCGAIMSDLTRTANGSFTLENSATLETLKEDFKPYVIDMESALSAFERADFDEHFGKLLLNGVKLMDKKAISNIIVHGFYKVYINDSFVGIGLFDIEGFKLYKTLI